MTTPTPGQDAAKRAWEMICSRDCSTDEEDIAVIQGAIDAAVAEAVKELDAEIALLREENYVANGRYTEIAMDVDAEVKRKCDAGDVAWERICKRREQEARREERAWCAQAVWLVGVDEFDDFASLKEKIAQRILDGPPASAPEGEN